MKFSALALSGLLASLIAIAPASANEPVQQADPAKGQAIATTVCVGCHTSDGTRGVPTFPILQGQHKEYIAKQLADFKSGKRANPLMLGFASTLSEQDMKNIGAYFESKKAEAGAATDKDLAALGQKIWRGGIADRSIPACAGCHGPTGAGLPSQYPRLAGQHAAYTEAQLVAYRAGTRTNNPQMLGVAAKLNDREIKALADYIAGQQ